ncbi:MAG TPA: hypothetical protein VHZ25_08920 [Acidobacteriaceae bacterium]|jgi:hypothetical protein|nr:hypothetical protein [Acidobacteriaceae bacterium]
MRIVDRLYKLPLFLAILLLGSNRGLANTGQPQAASVLLEQFETVFYARADLLEGSGAYRQLSAQISNTLRVPFANLLQGLDPLGKQVSAEMLGNADAALVGAKDFRSPSGPPPNLGGVQSSSCYIIVLKKRNSFDLGRVASKSSVISSAGGSVWKWSAPPSEGHPQPYTFYAAQVAGAYVLISNNADDLGGISGKLSIMSAAPNLDGIPDWATLSQHEVWGYRRYRHTEENKTAAGTSEVTPEAQALSFFADPKQKTGVLRLFSSTASTSDKMNATGTIPPFKAVGSGVWQTTIPLTEDQKTSEQMFVVMSWFGFGVYV